MDHLKTHTIITTNQFSKSLRESVKHWYIPVIIGIILILTGIWTFSSLVQSYLALTILFRVSFLVSGLLEIIFAYSNRKSIEGWGWTLTMGILTAMIGLMLLSHPAVSLLSLPLYIGFMIMFRSVGSIGNALDLKNHGVKEWGSLLFFGVLGMFFSFMLIWNPIFAGLTIIFWTSMMFLATGIYNAYLAIKMKSMSKNREKLSTELKTAFKEVENKLSTEFQ